MGTGWNILIAVLAGVGIMSFVFLGFLIIRSAYASSHKKPKNGSAGKKKCRPTLIRTLVTKLCQSLFAGKRRSSSIPTPPPAMTGKETLSAGR